MSFSSLLCSYFEFFKFTPVQNPNLVDTGEELIRHNPFFGREKDMMILEEDVALSFFLF